jgi:hypothetical protein
MRSSQYRADFEHVGRNSLRYLPLLVLRWLPEGRREGHEWVARNPTRSDQRRGSFKVNLRSGKWADFATGDKGGDVISLAAYLHGLSQSAAANNIADMLGMTREQGS